MRTRKIIGLLTIIALTFSQGGFVAAQTLETDVSIGSETATAEAEADAGVVTVCVGVAVDTDGDGVCDEAETGSSQPPAENTGSTDSTTTTPTQPFAQSYAFCFGWRGGGYGGHSRQRVARQAAVITPRTRPETFSSVRAWSSDTYRL